MDVYEFDKCLLHRLEESMDVLSYKDGVIPASRVRLEWSYYIELQIEPVGWQALWKIPRVICEELNLRFPTIVFGMVEQVLFKELKAVIIILAVQDEDVHLPERQEVNLEDLWPTKMQENSELNIERTADCIDRLRFFYNHVWMPWDNDNDDDMNWVEKHLESRIRFCYDLKKKSMKRSLAVHIKTLLTEARYIQQRREYLEIGLSDDEELDDTLDKTQITDLMRLHLRLAIIKSEIEMLENPEMRKIYEEIKFDDDKCLKRALDEKLNDRQQIAYIVTEPFTFKQQMQFLTLVGKFVDEEKLVQMCPSLQDVLNICNASDDIYLPPGRHSIKFLEYLNDDGKIIGLDSSSVVASTDTNENEVVIMSLDDDTILLIFDGNFTLNNLTLDCRNIRSGILVKNGKVCLKNCKIIGDGKSSTQQGIMCSGSSELFLEDCVLENFSNGIVASDLTAVTLTNCKINNCRIGIDVGSTSKIHFQHCTISQSKKCGIYFETKSLNNKAEGKKLLLHNLTDLSQYICTEMPWFGECDFLDCHSNIFVLNEKDNGFPKTLECILAESNDYDSKRLGTGTKRLLDNSDVIILDDSVVEINYDTE
ncbi:protein nessun dorma [Episyrphus balteatus]|uniref:protein nessun dorma n=1 Tax=Episyrphus balteatus TaxID=286459 RepID=UPI002485F6FB|nr:protein nessun dorma [Episyrphus balteatus]